SEFVGQHLGKRGHDSLAHLDFSGKTGHPAVFPDTEESIEILGKLRPPRGTALPLNGTRIGYGQEDNDASAYQFQKLSSIQGQGGTRWLNAREVPCQVFFVNSLWRAVIVFHR